MIMLALIGAIVTVLVIVHLISRKSKMPTDKEVQAKMNNWSERSANEPLHINHMRRHNK